MTFSIITVVYNNIEGLKETYKSIMSQSFVDYEWIVIDGGSNDGTQAFLSSLTINNLIYISEKDKGIYDAMNKGITLVSGNFSIFLNGGDTFYSDTVLEVVHEAIICEGNSESVLYGGFAYFFNSGRIKEVEARDVEYILHSLPSSHQSFFYPLKFLKENQYDLNYKVSSDYFLTVQAYIQSYSFIKLDLTISKFMLGGFSGKYYSLAIKEAYEIQKKILGVSYIKRILSGVKRYLAYNIMSLLNKNNF
ncbi:MAG: glycosyltransferase family 2 protein [Flectobacillus sp.]|nr:glycosyltransferase family 2 protein [Flectobacillus sp.]